MPNESETTSVAVKYGDTKLAVWLTLSPLPRKYVSCPLHKRNFTLREGNCLNDPEYQILTFTAQEAPDDSGDIQWQLLLPPETDVDAVL
jgi:nitrite reductase (NAD(P)H)